MDRKATESLISRHEGVRYTVYTDTVGKPTIGIGFNLIRAGARDRIRAVNANYEDLCAGTAALTESQVFALFAVDLTDAIGSARAIVKNFAEHPDPVQSVIVDMVFNLGPAGFAKFKKTIAAFEANDYCTAAAQMADSTWAAQVPNRARENIKTVMGYCKS